MSQKKSTVKVFLRHSLFFLILAFYPVMPSLACGEACLLATAGIGTCCVGISAYCANHPGGSCITCDCCKPFCCCNPDKRRPIVSLQPKSQDDLDAQPLIRTHGRRQHDDDDVCIIS